MAIPILKSWTEYFGESRHEGLGSSYERVILNRKLLELKSAFGIDNCLEAPAFGFTGVSGINSMILARLGANVCLVDHDEERIRLIRQVWKETGLPVGLFYSKDYHLLPFESRSFDLSWNFSALWFVRDLHQFLNEIIRVTRKAIFFCIPNRLGMGFIIQKCLSKRKSRLGVHENHIVPRRVVEKMESLGWRLAETHYIDAPPWPDIGMKKEDLLGKFGKKTKEQNIRELCILNYYSGKDPGFEKEMMKHFWFEKYSPNLVKMFWAHHRYYLFQPA